MLSSPLSDATPFDRESREHHPTFHRLYNLFESRLPGTGHLASMIALSILSKHVAGDARKVNLNIIADAGDGKSATLRQFQGLPYIHSLGDTTFSMFLRSKGGRFCKAIGSGFIPDGVKGTKSGQPDVSDTPDLLNNYTLMIPDGEAIADKPDHSFQKLMDLWSPLIEEGFILDTGDNYNGRYDIGCPASPISLNLVLGTPSELHRRFLQRRTLATRLLPAHYRTLTEEREDIARRIEHQQLDREPQFQEEVGQILYGKIKPDEKFEVNLPLDVQDALHALTKTIAQLKLFTIWRGDTDTTKRDSKIALHLVQANALMNGRKEASFADVCLVVSLVQSMSITKVSHLNSEGGTTTDTFYTGSRAHFLTLLCQMVGVDSEEHLSKFPDFYGNKLYSKERIAKVKSELGLGR